MLDECVPPDSGESHHLPAGKNGEKKTNLHPNLSEEKFSAADEIFRYPIRGRTYANITDAQHLLLAPQGAMGVLLLLAWDIYP